MEHAIEHGLEHEEHSNKLTGLIIAILALCLSLAETGAKSSQTEALNASVETADTWAFYQARNIRITTLRTAAEALELEAAQVADPAAKQAMNERIAAWRKTADRYDSDPERGEGRKELEVKARGFEDARTTALERYHHYELASAAFQIAIVLASTQVITGLMALLWFAGALGVVGVVFSAIGFFAPHAVHLL